VKVVGIWQTRLSSSFALDGPRPLLAPTTEFLLIIFVNAERSSPSSHDRFRSSSLPAFGDSSSESSFEIAGKLDEANRPDPVFPGFIVPKRP